MSYSPALFNGRPHTLELSAMKSGFEAARFVTQHECPVCLSAMRDPVQTECGHLFCRGCLETALTGDHECPVCLSAMRDPVQTECGHLFCRGCLETALTGDHECPVCLSAMRDPVQTECGHLFCRGCLETALTGDRRVCPVDNNEISKDNVCLHDDALPAWLDVNVYSKTYHTQL